MNNTLPWILTVLFAVLFLIAGYFALNAKGTFESSLRHNCTSTNEGGQTACQKDLDDLSSLFGEFRSELRAGTTTP